MIITLLLLVLAVLALRCNQLSKQLARKIGSGSKVLAQYSRLEKENAELNAKLDETLKALIEVATQKGTLQAEKQWAENQLAQQQRQREQAEAQFKNQYYTLRNN